MYVRSSHQPRNDADVAELIRQNMFASLVTSSAAPTWDYVAAHCYGTPILHSDDEARRNIQRLLDVVEADLPRPWSMNELRPDDVGAMIRNVVSFEIPLTRIEAKFKLNQGEKRERTATAAAQLESQGDTALANYIRRYNDL